MLEESSFAHRQAEYFWLLLQSASMLLVRQDFLASNRHEPTSLQVIITSREHALPLLSTRLRTNLHLVSTTPVCPNIAVRRSDGNCAVPSTCACRFLLASERYLACRSRGSSRMRGGTYRMVRPRRLGEGDGRRAWHLERSSGGAEKTVRGHVVVDPLCTL